MDPVWYMVDTWNVLGIQIVQGLYKNEAGYMSEGESLY